MYRKVLKKYFIPPIVDIIEDYRIPDYKRDMIMYDIYDMKKCDVCGSQDSALLDQDETQGDQSLCVSCNVVNCCPYSNWKKKMWKNIRCKICYKLKLESPHYLK